MPKIVDHAERRRQLVAAALQVITTEGFAAVSVRRVAEESGHSVGALRHYFPSRQALLDAVVGEVTDVAAARLVPRILALESAGTEDVLDAACGLLGQLVPLDAQRRTEWALWTALDDPSSGASGLQQWRRAGWAGTRHHCRHVLRRLREPSAGDGRAQVEHIPSADEILAQTQAMTPLPDPACEARAATLHAVVDGLSVQTTSFPEDMPPVQAEAVLRQAVADLAEQQAPARRSV